MDMRKRKTFKKQVIGLRYISLFNRQYAACPKYSAT